MTYNEKEKKRKQTIQQITWEITWESNRVNPELMFQVNSCDRDNLIEIIFEETIKLIFLKKYLISNNKTNTLNEPGKTEERGIKSNNSIENFQQGNWNP